MITAVDIVREARALCGTPWRHRGRTSAGVDCIGLVVLAARNAGLDLFAYCGITDQAYGRKPQKKLFELVDAHCRPVDNPEPGALLLFKFPGDRYARHFGIYTDRETLIHAECKSRMSVIEHGHRMQWIDRTHSCWRLPGVEYP